MSEGEVTFVGGHAVEQDGGGSEPAGDHAEERAEAVEAVRKALAEEAGKEAADGAKKAPKPGEVPGAKKAKEEAAAEPTKETVDPDTASVKQAIRNREKLAAEKARYSAEAAKAKAEMQQMWAQLQAEKQAIESQRQQLARLKSDPVAAIKESGWDPEELIINLAKQGTPEGKLEAERRAFQAKLDEMEQWRKQELQQREQWQQQALQRQAIEHRQSVEQQFLSHALDEERSPALASLYKGREAALVAEGDLVAQQYRKLTGREASLEDIVEYLEEEVSNRASNWYSKKAGTGTSQSGAAQVATPQAKPKPRQGGSGGKTLTGAGSSERRALGKDFADLEGDERRQTAIAAVRAALASSSE